MSSEQLGHFCPIDAAITASEQEISEFQEGVADKEIVAHDIVRDTAKRRRVFGRICALSEECDGLVTNSQGYRDCPRRVAYSEALELQTVSGETVHADGAMQSPAIMIRGKILSGEMSEEEGEQAIKQLQQLSESQRNALVSNLSNSKTKQLGQYL